MEGSGVALAQGTDQPERQPIEEEVLAVIQKPGFQAVPPSALTKDLASDEEMEMEDPLQMPVEDTIQPVTQKPDLQAQAPSAPIKDLASDEEMEMEDPLQMPVEDTIQPIVSTETTQLASVPPHTEEKKEEVVEPPSNLAEVESHPAPEATELVGGKKAKKGGGDRKGTSSSSGESAEQQQQQRSHQASESAEPADGKKAKKTGRNRKGNSSSSGESASAVTPADEPVKQSPTLEEEPNSAVPPKGQRQKKGNKRTSESSVTKDEGKQPEKVTPGAPVEDVIQSVAAAETLQSAPVPGALAPDLASDEELEMADPLAEGFTPVYKSPEGEKEEQQPLPQASESAEPADGKKAKKPGKNRNSTSSSSGEHAPSTTLVEEPNSASQPKGQRQKKGSKRTSESSVTHDEGKQQEQQKAADPSPEAKPVEDVIQPAAAAAETLQSAPAPGAPLPDLASDEEMEMADPLAENFAPVEEPLPSVQSTADSSPPNLEQPVEKARTEPQEKIPVAAKKDKKDTHRQKSKSGSEREPKKGRQSPKGASVGDTAGPDEPKSEGSQNSGEQGAGKKKSSRKEEKPRVEKQSSDSKVKPKLEAGEKEPEPAVEPLVSEQVTTALAAVPVPARKAEEQFATSKPTTSLSEIADKLEEVVEIATQKEQKSAAAAAAKQKPAGKATQQQQKKKQQPEKVPSEAPVESADGQVQSAAASKAATKAPKKTPKQQQQPKKKVASSQPKPVQESE
ncbi:unnamed protein product [Dibothriocephalus latus]|uniref:Uncharacterized protein n=1 Tax=Dibothriocephalus latus TaxID=60516 RepID=A0A3P7LIA2_DIBLA|nr:unnamed protein product [Dibothriocephalus latus]